MLLLAVGLAAGGLVLARSRREPETQEPAGTTPAEPPEPSEPSIDELYTRAGASLVEADNAITTSSAELRIAQAESDDKDAWEQFSTALAQSRAELDEALLLHDQGPEGDDEPGRRTWLEAIIKGADSADARLDTLVPQFDARRDLENRIDELLPRIERDLAGLADPLRDARATALDLRNRYPEVAVAPVLGNLSHAEELLRAARDWAAASARDLAGGDRRTAVARARVAEEALGQASTLLDGIQDAPEELAQAERAVTALLATTEGGIAEAERLGMPEGLSTTHSFAQDTVHWARGEADTGSYDPMATRRALEDTDSALEVGLAPRRAAQEARRRALALLEYVPATARSSLRLASCFITTRRGAVGPGARVCLARASSLVTSGSGATQSDPPTALADLQQADALADQALRLAQQDEAGYLNAQRMDGQDPALSTLIAGGILLSRPAPDGAQWVAASFGGAATRTRWVLRDLP